MNQEQIEDFIREAVADWDVDRAVKAITDRWKYEVDAAFQRGSVGRTGGDGAVRHSQANIQREVRAWGKALTAVLILSAVLALVLCCCGTQVVGL